MHQAVVNKLPLSSVVQTEPVQPQLSREKWMNLRRLSHAADVSPLRYPGGKRKLALLVAQIFALSETRPKLLVEPFAGGASVAIALLETDFVDEIVLADADEMVAAFWQIVFSDEAEIFAQMIENAKVTMKERKRLLASRPRSALNLAYKCLFLNRTSFSGILKGTAGAVGGKNQRGTYKLGCRFNQARIAERIRTLSKLRHRVRFVRCQSYNDTLAQVASMPDVQAAPNSVFWYFDPPFFEKASRLYRKSFAASDHVQFKATLERVPGHFVLSYDDVAESERMYGDDKRLMRFGLQYTMNGDNEERPKVLEIIISDLTPSFKAKMTAHNRTRSILAGKMPRKKHPV